MIVRMTRWRARPGTDAESRHLWESAVRPIWWSQPGLVRAHLLAATDSDERMTFSVWRTADDYDAFVRSPDLVRVVEAYDHIYTDDGRPRAQDWTVLTEDWQEA